MIGLGICNSSPLISLNRIKRLDLLQAQFLTIIVPEMVAAEVNEIPTWITVKKADQPRIVDVFPSNIHKGEAEVITLAVEMPDAILVLDDWFAREYAQQRGFKIIGTVGLIVRAKRKGLIEAGMPLLQNLCEVGFRVSDKVLADAQRLMSE